MVVRGIERRGIFEDDEDREDFIERLVRRPPDSAEGGSRVNRRTPDASQDLSRCQGPEHGGPGLEPEMLLTLYFFPKRNYF
jgi:hypothetical protein